MATQKHITSSPKMLAVPFALLQSHIPYPAGIAIDRPGGSQLDPSLPKDNERTLLRQSGHDRPTDTSGQPTGNLRSFEWLSNMVPLPARSSKTWNSYRHTVVRSMGIGPERGPTIKGLEDDRDVPAAYSAQGRSQIRCFRLRRQESSQLQTSPNASNRLKY
jgi:hypothetical protein